MNEKTLHILYKDMYIIIHIPKGIYHVVPFRIAQSCGIKNSSHFVKIRLLGAGCKVKLERCLGNWSAAACGFWYTKMTGLRPYVM
jgi:hypothetical protein